MPIRSKLSSCPSSEFSWKEFDKYRKKELSKPEWVYGGRRTSETMLPYKMHELVDEGQITIDECEKFMKMLYSKDEEIVELACVILENIHDTWKINNHGPNSTD